MEQEQEVKEKPKEKKLNMFGFDEDISERGQAVLDYICGGF